MVVVGTHLSIGWGNCPRDSPDVTMVNTVCSALIQNVPIAMQLKSGGNNEHVEIGSAVTVSSKKNDPTTTLDDTPHQTESIDKFTALTIWTFGFSENQYKELYRFTVSCSFNIASSVQTIIRRNCILTHLSLNPFKV
jgi:hypothetical protein